MLQETLRRTSRKLTIEYQKIRCTGLSNTNIVPSALRTSIVGFWYYCCCVKSCRLTHNCTVGAPERRPVVAEIVAESLRKQPRAWLWVGMNAWRVWFGTTFLGRTAFVSLFHSFDHNPSITSVVIFQDSLFTKKFALNKLKQLFTSGSLKKTT